MKTKLPICGHCKKRKCASNWWATGCEPQYKYMKNDPLMFQGMPICENCFIGKDEQPKFMKLYESSLSFCGDSTGDKLSESIGATKKTRNEFIRGMKKVMLEVREHEMRKAGIK